MLLQRSLRFGAILVCTLALLRCPLGWGQCSGGAHVVPLKDVSVEQPGAASSEKPLQASVDVVLVPVVVTDSLNHPIVNLKKQDFAIYEENKLQEIQYFSMEQAPVSIALLLDVSKSMSDKIDAERAAIAEFVKNAHPDDEYFAIAFSDRPRLLVDSTRSADDIERKLVSAPRGGSTAMLDAIYLAIDKLRSARYRRRAIVIISDGGDNASRYTLRQTKRLVKESDVQIFAVGLFDNFFHSIEEKLGKKWLSEITDVTGGRTVTVENEKDLPEAAATISWEMRDQYVLGYRTGKNGSQGWRKIRVRLTSPQSQRSLKAYYRRGYLAPGN